MYGNDEKARWRDELWRKAAQHSDKSGWVLTLAGARFLDRKTAAKCGFKRARIVGVDSSREVERHNTKFGRTVISASLANVVATWRDSKPVSVVNADYCSNVTNPEIKNLVLSWMGNAAFSNSILCLTVSVGRESGDHKFFLEAAAHRMNVSLRDVNRAAHGIVSNAYMVLSSVKASAADAIRRGDEWFDSAWLWSKSYTAHRMRMDSCMVRHPAFGLLDLEEPRARLDRILKQNEQEVTRVQRTVSAKLAWHTMRMGGTAH